MQGLYEGTPTSDITSRPAAFPNAPLVIPGQFSLMLSSHVSILLYQVHYGSENDLQVLQNSLFILHFVLEGISTAGSPANVVHEFLWGFFKDTKRLIFEEVTFNLSDDNASGEHEDNMAFLARTLAK
jgi:hypothetical protein